MILLLFLLLAPLSTLAAQSPTFDLVIRNGHIVDGTGSPWYAGDVGIRDGRIAAIGRLDGAKAKRTVDAKGKVVAPGFIDMLGQSEMTILVNPSLPSKVFQGITTEITGEGGSPGPLNDAIIAADKTGYDQLGITPDWRTLGQYYRRLEKQGIGLNMATYVGATQVRRMVLGDDDKDPTPADLDRMRELVRQGMRRGRGRPLHLAPVPSGPVRGDLGADRPGERSREVRRRVRHPHAERERRDRRRAG